MWSEALKKGLEKHCGVHISAIITNSESKWGKKIDNVTIYSPQKLADMDYEKIFVCVYKESSRNEIKMQLEEMGIPTEKVVFMLTSSEYMDAYLEIDPVRKNWIKAFAEYTKEIGMLGSVAECGVFYGDTAMFINKDWPDRTLHLFDTFEGFSDRDAVHDIDSYPAFAKGAFASAGKFKAGTPESMIEVVKSRMCYPDNLKIHKGYFPECAGIIEDSFCFVNLDMDLYQPQLEGLRYFWNKMEPGGIILLHDYYHPMLPGVKKAVIDFEKELGDMLLKFPIGDYCSIAVMRR